MEEERESEGAVLKQERVSPQPRKCAICRKSSGALSAYTLKLKWLGLPDTNCYAHRKCMERRAKKMAASGLRESQ